MNKYNIKNHYIAAISSAIALESVGIFGFFISETNFYFVDYLFFRSITFLIYAIIITILGIILKFKFYNYILFFCIYLAISVIHNLATRG